MKLTKLGKLLIGVVVVMSMVLLFSGKREVVQLDTEKLEEETETVYRWDHMPLTYQLENACLTRAEGKFEQDIESALDFITKRTNEIIQFERIESGTPDIFYVCSEESSKRLFGEAHPFYYQEWGTYAPGKVYYYKGDECDRPIVMIHETLHMLGLDHNTNTTRQDIMRARYRKDTGCDRDIIDEDVEFLKNTYGIYRM